MHAILLVSALPLFVGALLSNWAYAASYQVQWTNFAAWLIAGGLVLVGVALLWAVIDIFRLRTARMRRGTLYLLLLTSTAVVAFINSLVHAKDGWAAMPAGLWLSLIMVALGLVTGWLGLSAVRPGVTR